MAWLPSRGKGSTSPVLSESTCSVSLQGGHPTSHPGAARRDGDEMISVSVSLVVVVVTTPVRAGVSVKVKEDTHKGNFCRGF